MGVILGNFFSFQASNYEWLVFLAGLGSVVLTFLAGAEMDIEVMKKNWRANLTIGAISFFAPFIGIFLLAYLVVGWSWTSSLLAGIVLSDTSVAVVYVVLVETGVCRTKTGSTILSSCFITNLFLSIALSLLFTSATWKLIVLVVAVLISIFVIPKVLRYALTKLEGKSGQPEVKLLLFMIVAVGAAAEFAGVVAALPAYILGVMTASVLATKKDTLLKVRIVALAFLTPFFNINAGLNVSILAVAGGIFIVLFFFGGKIVTKFAGIFPVARKFARKDAAYITLLMSTGLTFGIISAQYGLTNGVINTQQFSILVAVVILTAIVPTVIAQKRFNPAKESSG